MLDKAAVVVWNVHNYGVTTDTINKMERGIIKDRRGATIGCPTNTLIGGEWSFPALQEARLYLFGPEHNLSTDLVQLLIDTFE